MAVISFTIEIDGAKINATLNLEGQQLYFFEQRDEQGKQAWLKSHVQGKLKIEDIKITK